VVEVRPSSEPSGAGRGLTGGKAPHAFLVTAAAGGRSKAPKGAWGLTALSSLGAT